MPSGGPGGQRDDLTRYVADYMTRTGQSVRELARRARDPESGIRPSHGWLQDIVNGHMDRAPDLRRLRALAVAMGEPVETLARLSAAQWLNVDVIQVEADESGDWVGVPVKPGTPEEERERIRRMMADLVRHWET